LEEIMTTNPAANSERESVQRPAVRSRQIGVRITEEEYAEFEQMAWKSGKTLGDWARERIMQPQFSGDAFAHLLTEIVGLQLFLTNTLSSVVRGERMSVEQYQELMRNVKTNKRRAAREAIAQYAAEIKEERHA
jgi:hypothetical protein